jgi:hypothetical protein
MILRIENLTDGNLSIEAVRTSFEAGETKDVTLNRKLDSILIDNNAELAQLIADGDITLEQIMETMKGYRSPLTLLNPPGVPTVITHNLGVAVERQKIDIIENTGGAGGVFHKWGFFGDATAPVRSGLAVIDITPDTITLVLGAADAAVGPPPITPTTHAIVRIDVDGE